MGFEPGMSNSKIQCPAMSPYLVCFSISVMFPDTVTCFTVRLKLTEQFSLSVFSLKRKTNTSCCAVLNFFRDLILNLTGFSSREELYFSEKLALKLLLNTFV